MNILNDLIDRIFKNLNSTAQAAVIGLATFLSDHGVTISQAHTTKIAAWIALGVTALYNLFKRDAPKPPEEPPTDDTPRNWSSGYRSLMIPFAIFLLLVGPMSAFSCRQNPTDPGNFERSVTAAG